jgi:hypothetical protein
MRIKFVVKPCKLTAKNVILLENFMKTNNQSVMFSYSGYRTKYIRGIHAEVISRKDAALVNLRPILSPIYLPTIKAGNSIMD